MKPTSRPNVLVAARTVLGATPLRVQDDADEPRAVVSDVGPDGTPMRPAPEA